MKIINIINNKLSWIEQLIIVVFLSIMVVLAFTQVILRNFFSFGFLWADPLLRYMVMWIGFLGAVIATKEEKHFGVDFLNRFLSPRLLSGIKIFVDTFAAVIAFLLMRAAIQFLMEGIDADEKDLFDLPRRLYFAIIPIGFGLIGLHFVFNIIRYIHSLFSLKNQKNKEPIPSIKL
jgi:TRAP-type C4-dicarboxylate transport system permease small subunit